MKNLWIGILLVLIGCTSQNVDIPEHIKDTKNLKAYSANAEPAASIELTREATFKAPEKFYLEWYDDTITFYSWFAGIEIDDSGRVYIADNTAKKIHVFNSAGNHLVSKGEEGRGPGEFYGITDTEMVQDRLYVFDYMGFRTTIFSLDPFGVAEAGTVRPPVNQDEVEAISGWRRAVPLLRSDGSYLAGFIEQLPDARVGSPSYNLDEDRPIRYYFMSQESKIISDKILQPSKGHIVLTAQVDGRHVSNIRPFPFMGRSVIKISDSNHIYSTWTDDFLIKIYGPDGNYQRAIYYPVQKKSINRKEIVSLFHEDDYYHDLVKHAELPTTWPAIYSMVIDDHDRLWVSTIVEEKDARQWWVLKNTGRLVAKFRWPENRTIKAVKDGHAYALETNQETGQQKMVKYEVEMGRK